MKGARSLRGVVIIVALALVAITASAGAASASRSAEGVPALGHVFLIIGENVDDSHLTPTNAPFLLGTVRPASAWFTNYFAATHWSEANYAGLVSGQYNDCEQADGSPTACHQNVDNLLHQLDVAGLTWKVWLEGGNAACPLAYTTTEESSSYFTTGNPPTLFDDIEGPNGVWSATTPSSECLANDVPAGPATPPFVINATGMATFNADLETGDVGNFNFIVPNGCESADKDCTPVHNRVTQFDNFLAREIPRIEASPAYAKNGAIVILFDEDQRMGGMAQVGFGQGGRTPCALLSPLAVPGDYANVTYEYSVLRTLEDGFRLPGYVGYAVDVAPLPLAWT